MVVAAVVAVSVVVDVDAGGVGGVVRIAAVVADAHGVRG